MAILLDAELLKDKNRLFLVDLGRSQGPLSILAEDMHEAARARVTSLGKEMKRFVLDLHAFAKHNPPFWRLLNATEPLDIRALFEFLTLLYEIDLRKVIADSGGHVLRGGK